MKKWMYMICFVTFLLLFCEKITGELVHVILGLLLGIGFFIHIFVEKKRIRKMPVSWLFVDACCAIALLVTLVSGLLIHPMGRTLWTLIMHSLGAVVLLLACIYHLIQHQKSAGRSTVNKGENIPV